MAGVIRTPRGVLAIGDDQVRHVSLQEVRKRLLHHLPARLADNIADEENLHATPVISLQSAVDSPRLSTIDRTSTVS